MPIDLMPVVRAAALDTLQRLGEVEHALERLDRPGDERRIDQYLAGAVERREPWGVWGGELFQAGVVIARKRPRGRPRKNAIAA